METDGRGLEVLAPDECIDLLASTGIGRVGFHAAALPIVLPVAFVLDGRGIMIRTRTGSQLHAATRDTVVAFEADHVDLESGAGWSVAVTGRARHMTAADEVAEARSLFGAGWDGTGHDCYVRIALQAMSGRRGRIAVPRGVAVARTS